MRKYEVKLTEVHHIIPQKMVVFEIEMNNNQQIK